jgi:acid phosphatase
MKYIYKIKWLCLMYVSMVTGACTITVPVAPVPNLGDAKQVVQTYYKDGQYEKDLEGAVKEAIEYLQLYPRENNKLAVVLDIDETALSNWSIIKANDFGYIVVPNDKCQYFSQAWNCWIKKASAPAIGPTLNLYRTARHLGFAVFFVSARHESERKATEQNLRNAVYRNWSGLILMPHGKTFSSVAIFKVAERRKLTEQGWTIVANIGDQPTDLEGGYAEHTFLLPNPFYRIR